MGDEQPLSDRVHDAGSRCPGCGLWLTFRLRVTDIRASVDQETWVKGVSQVHGMVAQTEEKTAAAQRRAVEESGILPAFRAVVAVIWEGMEPQDVTGFFLTVLRTARPRQIPAPLLRIFSRAFGGQTIEYWAAQGIGIVLADGHIKMFVPNETMRGTRIKSAGKRGGGSTKRTTLRLDDSEVKLTEWIRTKFGYVEGNGMFFDSMRRRSIGEFARPIL